MREDKLSIPFLPCAEDVREATSHLTDMICQTEDYKCYQKNLAIVRQQEEIYKQFQEFQRRSLALQMEREDQEYFEKLEALHAEYKNILTEPIIVDFLSAEQRMCNLMRSVYDKLAEDVKLDLSYMD